MSLDTETPEGRSKFRLRFSLLALLLLITLTCLFLGWWRFDYHERQRLLARREVIAQYIDDLNKKIVERWEIYLAIAKDSGRMGDEALLELETKQLDRINAEVLQLEHQMTLGETPGGKSGESTVGRRLAELREQEVELLRQISRRTERSVELETMAREIGRLQRTVDDLTREQTSLDIEIATREKTGR